MFVRSQIKGVSVDNGDLEDFRVRLSAGRRFHIREINTAFNISHIPNDFIHLVRPDRENLHSLNKEAGQIVDCDDNFVGFLHGDAKGGRPFLNRVRITVCLRKGENAVSRERRRI